MKTLLLTISTIISFVFQKAIGQTAYFEGKTFSTITFEIKDSTKRAIYFSKINASSAIEYFKNGNSFVVYDKGDTKTYLYLQPENKVYQNHWNKDTLYYFDCGVKGREIITYSIEKNAEKLLGFQCDKLQVVFSGGTTTYYFNENSLRLNPEWYQKLTYVNWDFISSMIKSIPLKTVIERNDYRIINTVISYSREKVNDKVFKFPATTIIIEDK